MRLFRCLAGIAALAAPAHAAAAAPFWTGPCDASPAMRREALAFLEGTWLAEHSVRPNGACWTSVVEAWRLGPGPEQESIRGQSRSLVIRAAPEGCAAGSEGTMRLVIDAAPDGPRCALSLRAELADPEGRSPVRRLPVDWNYYWGGSPNLIVELTAGAAAVSFAPLDSTIREEWRRRLGHTGTAPLFGPFVYPGLSGHHALMETGRDAYRFRGFAGENVVWKASGQRPPVFPGIPSSFETQTLPVLDPKLRIEGPGGFAAEGEQNGSGWMVRATLPADGEYRVVVTSIQGSRYGLYYLEMQDDPAIPPVPGDCSRYRLSEYNRSQPISSEPVRPGGTTRLRPLWSMRGQTYDVPFECLTNWRVSDGRMALLSPDRRSISIAGDASAGRIQVTAEVEGREYVGFINIDD
ncbi:MAG TPA: hypothetical protein VEX35_01365 [Allosphingosinicella sp.]|nr:hypothetical protein [Allosphingosinicella sp.]